MTTYSSLCQINGNGLDTFKKVLSGNLPETEIDPLSPELVTPIMGTKGISVTTHSTAKEFAQQVLHSLGEAKLHDHVSNDGLWTWLTFVMRDVLFKRDPNGTLITGENCRWYPAKLNDYRNANQHIVRMPVVLLERFGNSADHMLCGPPNEIPKIRYTLTRSQGMMNAVFQSVARKLYFNDESGKLKPGVGSTRGGGTAYRLAQVFKQLDVTWEIEYLEPNEFMKILPSEFDRFK